MSDSIAALFAVLQVIHRAGVVPFWGEAVGLSFKISRIHDARDFVALARAGEPAAISHRLFGGPSGTLLPVCRCGVLKLV